MSYKYKYIMVLAIISALIPLPGAIANLCGASLDVLIPLATIPLLVSTLVLFISTPISLCSIFYAVITKQWKVAALLTVSLCFPLATFFAINVVNKPGFDAAMSV